MKRANAPEQTVQRIYEAIVNKNEKALAKELNMEGEQDSSAILSYLASQGLPAFNEKMQQAAGNVYRNGNPQTVRHEDGQDILKFTLDKKLGIYKVVNVGLVDRKLGTVKNGLSESSESRFPIELLKENAVYSTNWRDGNTLFHLYVAETENLPGLPADEVVKESSHALFLAKENEKEGVLQKGVISSKLKKEDIHEWNLESRRFLGFVDNETSLDLWTLENGSISQVLFDGQKSLPLVDGKVKFIDDIFLQTYEPIQGKEGWAFKTWVWNPDQLHFKHLHSESYTNDRPYGLETGQHKIELWNEYEAYYDTFPQFTFTKQSAELLKDGMLLHTDVQLGMSIKDVLQELPDPYDHDYYNGGIYYAFPGGRTIFYDELTGEVTFVTLGGSSLTNEQEELLAILGTPESEGYDDMKEEYYYSYTFGQNQLLVDRKRDGKIVSLWLSKRTE
ncbi:hypothetical protein [Sporosarcina cyprini]|uniref:hypothetical protein n=1 Tax=Sporosarcina cyprini TaxID=2910523 RepID=UPI001EDED715|nr:hypothetical protein [Sporosarcina cyprini]MCG3088022.1 hypothetical protein [Sporosarcina cyprini]